MKTINLFAASAMLLAAVACSSNKPAGNGAGADSTAVAPVVENVVSAKGLLPSKSEIDTVSYLVFSTINYSISIIIKLNFLISNSNASRRSETGIITSNNINYITIQYSITATSQTDTNSTNTFNSHGVVISSNTTTRSYCNTITGTSIRNTFYI